eukprot:GAHX01003407.1.p2 GENE.GAHX01003407.1~~GAHX01003407.1.p2  ORF type:complete len:57 (+),score=9.45 GAHX01003407.1:55-225(+)
MRSTNHDDDNSKENIDSIGRKSWENECTNECNSYNYTCEDSNNQVYHAVSWLLIAK